MIFFYTFVFFLKTATFLYWAVCFDFCGEIMSDVFDVAIIGSGPAGLWAAEELVAEKPGLKVAIFEKNSFSSGGLINDCKLNLTHKIGMDLEELKLSEREAEKLIAWVDEKFLRFGADPTVSGTDEVEIKKWVDRASRCGVDLIACRQRHIGTDKAVLIVKAYKEELEKKNVKFFMKTDIFDIEKKENLFLLYSSAGINSARFVLSAPGRDGAYWFREIAKKLGIDYYWSAVDIGVRVELLKEIYDPVTDVIYDPKFVFKTKCHGDKVRTFCTNPGGRVRIEPKNGKGFHLVNGDALKDQKTKNTNFAILNTINLTEPYADTTEMARSIANETNRLGGGIPIVQRMGDFLSGRRSKTESFFDKNKGYDLLEPSLKLGVQVMPGDISLAFRARIMENLAEAFDRLDRIVPGVTNPSTLIYAPEIKFYDTKYSTNSDLETNLSGLFVAGDGVGKSRGIIGAAITGIIAARGILKKI
jgi:uncharacterized FAD-dependent dehydrogenase